MFRSCLISLAVCLTLDPLFGQEWELRSLQRAGSVGQYTSLAFDPQGRTTITYYDAGSLIGDGTAGDLRLWHDDNNDGIYDTGECRTIDSSGNVGKYSSLAFDLAGRALVVYYHESSGDLRLWHDLDADYTFDSGELVTIASNNNVGQYASLDIDLQGHAAVAYQDSSVGDLHLWRDLDGDFGYDAGEIQQIDGATASLGAYASLGFDAEWYAVIAYYDSTNGDLKVWHEARGISSYDVPGSNVGLYNSLGFDSAGRATLAFYNSSSSDLLLWHDINMDSLIDITEIMPIYTSGSVGTYAALAFDSLGRVGVSYYDASAGDLHFWHDLDAGFDFDQGEIQALVIQGTVGQHTALAFTAGDEPAISHYDYTNSDLNLYYKSQNSRIDEGGPVVGTHVSGILDVNGNLAASYFDSTSGDLRFWHDENGDRQIDESEWSVIDGTSCPLDELHRGGGLGSG